MIDDLNDRLEAAADAAREVALPFLRGEEPRSRQDLEQICEHVAQIVGVLAVLQESTPKQIGVQVLEYVPNDRMWRDEILPRLIATARGDVDQ